MFHMFSFPQVQTMTPFKMPQTVGFAVCGAGHHFLLVSIARRDAMLFIASTALNDFPFCLTI